MLAELLGFDGFGVTGAHNGREGLEKAFRDHYDLIILDVMLPEIDGFEVLRRVRAQSEVPVLMLTARGDDVDKIVGLEIGADDYLSKPFNARELSARVRAILRRAARTGVSAGGRDDRNILQVGEVELNSGRRTVTFSGKAIRLTAAEFRLLSVLLQKAGNVVSREALSQKVLERPLLAEDRSIDVHISSLRRKLWPPPRRKDPIQAVRGIGYIYTLPGKDAHPVSSDPDSGK